MKNSKCKFISYLSNLSKLSPKDFMKEIKYTEKKEKEKKNLGKNFFSFRFLRKEQLNLSLFNLKFN